VRADRRRDDAGAEHDFGVENATGETAVPTDGTEQQADRAHTRSVGSSGTPCTSPGTSAPDG